MLNERRIRFVLFALIGALLLYIVGRQPFEQWLRRQYLVGSVPTSSLVSAQEGSPEPPLCLAAKSGNVAVVKELLERGANVDGAGQRNGTPLAMAIGYRHREVVHVLLEHGANPNAYSLTPVLDLAVYNLPDEVPNLFKYGVKVAGSNSLCTAIRRRDRETVLLLLKHGAMINCTATPGERSQMWIGSSGLEYPWVRSPLAAAACYAPEFEGMLKRLGADLGPDKTTLLVGVVYAGRTELIPHLIELGADVNGVASGETPLTEAVRYAPSAVSVLLANGAKPNVVTVDGRTPLKDAAMAGNTACARLLLAHGADVNFHARNEHAPLWYARKHKRADMVLLLQNAGGRDD